MPVDGLFSTTVTVLGKSIDLRARNQALIASNVANAETPNYTPKALSFENELQGALKSGSKSIQVPAHARHFPLKGASHRIQDVTGTIRETPAKTPGKDGNAVEIEAEMSRMTENQIMYNASVQILTKKFDGIKSALREGK